MKSKVFLLFSVLSVYSFVGYSQGYDQLKTQLQFENFYGSKYRSSAPSNDIIGSEFLYDNWYPVEVYFEGGSTEFEKGKLNLFSSSLEIIYKNKEMIIAPEHIKLISIPLLKKWFIPGSKYIYNDVVLDGFIEVFDPVLTESPIILAQHYVYIKKPNSNGYVNAGTTNSELIKSSKNYLFDGSKVFLIKNRKDFEKAYSDKKDQVKVLSKEGVNYKDPKSLQELVDKIKSS